MLSLEKGGKFILLSDERSPVFHCRANGVEKGLMSLLLELIPEKYKKSVLSISIQELVIEIKKTPAHQDWIHDFECKYGLV